MAKTVQIGNQFFDYPEQGEGAGHGQEATDAFVAVTEVLKDLQGPNDILETTAVLANNQTTPANIPGLSFDTATVRRIEIQFIIKRIYDAGASTVLESGTVNGNYDGIDFDISIESVGQDTGVTLSISPSGQFQYTSTNLTNHVSSEIKFRAKTLDE